MSKKIEINNLDQLVSDYNAGFSFVDLSKKYNISRPTIRKAFKAAGVPLRTMRESAVNRVKQKGYSRIPITEETKAKMRGPRPQIRGENNPNFRGSGRYSADGVWLTYDAKGYLRRMIKGHPLADERGYIGEHVYQACLKWGVDAVRGNDVHHKDDNKSNNEIDNLEILSRTEHRRIENNFQ